jgi:hypothetical protein
VKSVFIGLVACAMAGPCLAQEPVGCDKFKWPLDKERATLNGTDLPKVASGDRVTWPLPWEGVRKSVKFDLTARPLTLELSGVPADTIGIAVSGD